MEYLDEVISMRVKPSEKEKIKLKAAEQQTSILAQSCLRGLILKLNEENIHLI